MNKQYKRHTVVIFLNKIKICTTDKKCTVQYYVITWCNVKIPKLQELTLLYVTHLW